MLLNCIASLCLIVLFFSMQVIGQYEQWQGITAVLASGDKEDEEWKSNHLKVRRRGGRRRRRGGDAGRGGGRRGRPPRSDRGGTLHLHYAWYLFFNMLLNCFPLPIAGGRGRGRGRGRGTVLLSDIPSASGDVASWTAFSESPDEEIDSRDLEAESRDEEMVTASGPSSASTKKAKVRGETEVPKEEPAPEARTLIEPTRTE